MSTLLTSAANELLERRHHTKKFPRLDIVSRPTSIEESLAIQAQMSLTTSAKIAGWKCLLPLDEEKVIVAPIYDHTVWQGDVAKMHPDDGVARIEPEIAFILEKNLPAQDKDFTDKEIDLAIGKTHMALELIQSRYLTSDNADEQASFYEILADGLSNQGLYIGSEINKGDAYKASKISLSLTQSSQQQKFAGKHPNPLPQLPIYWLINYMTKKGISFKAGEAIITGSYAGVVNVAFDEELTIAYENLGSSTLIIEKL